ncbi:hypothetical protein PFDG_02689 [Plasmodium falciparum Dd2]|uniref:Uncharacterized protein n=1 Tax=Plasmodium falciparum (isolate Dd2) TaxID=57267 RepID=A0A0L7M2L1_PLAF4|nr:hypothetical protein PFDG_02689 [Plasmodium falciparum Dd2]
MEAHNADNDQSNRHHEHTKSANIYDNNGAFERYSEKSNDHHIGNNYDKSMSHLHTRTYIYIWRCILRYNFPVNDNFGVSGKMCKSLKKSFCSKKNKSKKRQKGTQPLLNNKKHNYVQQKISYLYFAHEPRFRRRRTRKYIKCIAPFYADKTTQNIYITHNFIYNRRILS